MSMEFKRVTLENIEEEHICCAISDKKGETCVASKKAWLKERLKEGLVFEKLDVRGKVLIEYLPAEYAWVPVDADGYYTAQCPHTSKYVPILAEYARTQGIEIKTVKLESREAARRAPSPFTTYSLFYDGKFVTNEILSEKSFEKYRKKV